MQRIRASLYTCAFGMLDHILNIIFMSSQPSRYGSCPHSGFGVGFERLLMYLTGINNARDVTLVPRIPGSVSL